MRKEPPEPVQLNHIPLVLGVMGVLIAVFPLSLRSADQPVLSSRSDILVEKQRSRMEENLDETKLLIKKLSESRSIEERQAVLAQFRSKLAAYSVRTTPEEPDRDTMEKSLARLQKATTDPEMRKRWESMMSRMEASQKLKSAMNAAHVAEPKNLPQALAEVSKRRFELAKIQEASFAEARKSLPEVNLREADPKAALVRAMIDERRRQMKALQNDLMNASPEERVKLLEKWQANRVEELNRQLAEVPR